MKEKHDKIDEVKNKELEEETKKIKKGNHMKRMLNMSQPKLYAFLGVADSVGLGSLMPVFGILIGKMLFVL